MSIPMPLAERFAPGTEWMLGIPYGTIPAGTRVRVEGEITSNAYDDQDLFVPCSIEESEQVFDIPIGLLA